jgi:hypothetical protein
MTVIFLEAMAIVVAIALVLPWVLYGLTAYFDYVEKRFK